MSAIRFDALILSSDEPEKTADFYRGVGLNLEEERHGEEPTHFACDLGGVHFAIFPAAAGRAPGQRLGGATKIGLKVEDVDKAFALALKLGAEPKLQPDDAPWGRNAVVLDPDGRTLEFNS